MPLHVSTGLLIFIVASLILGFMISADQKSADDSFSFSFRAREKKKKSRSLLRMTADALFFWISDDFRYQVAYPWLILGLTVAVGHFAPYSWPGRVLSCDGDVYGCLGVYDFRPHG
jgi:hypothetical protein